MVSLMNSTVEGVANTFNDLQTKLAPPRGARFAHRKPQASARSSSISCPVKPTATGKTALMSAPSAVDMAREAIVAPNTLFARRREDVTCNVHICAQPHGFPCVFPWWCRLVAHQFEIVLLKLSILGVLMVPHLYLRAICELHYPVGGMWKTMDKLRGSCLPFLRFLVLLEGPAKHRSNSLPLSHCLHWTFLVQSSRSASED